MTQHRESSQAGFTIIELMIATSIFSIILVMATTVILGVSNLYYKGINQSRVQGGARSLSDELTEHIQVDGPVTEGANMSNTIFSYCTGTTRYSYVLDRQILKESPHVLWRDVTIPGDCTPVDITNAGAINVSKASRGGTELMIDNGRLTSFCIGTVDSTTPRRCKNPAEPYNLSIAVAYGDTDLLDLKGYDTTCRGDIGRQFCATASLTTKVIKRKHV